MSKKLIVANWKMSPDSASDAKRIFSGIKTTASKLKKVTTVVCPPFVYLPLLSGLVAKSVVLGGQDVFWKDQGSYTGEISLNMLRDLGAKYVIIGHSERRIHVGETDEIINKKVMTALKGGLKIIFCVGERERVPGENHLGFIKEEIEEGLKGIPRKLFKNLIVAYEPIWAIGKRGSEADNPDDVFQMTIHIRRSLLSIVGKELVHSVPIIYGGSIDSKNTEEFLRDANVQGLLVGHNSLIPKEFSQILKVAEG